MTTPTDTPASPPMTPERWRTVDAILQAALACDPERRDAIVAAACGDDEALRNEVASLLAAHIDDGDNFLERPATDARVARDAPPPVGALASALADRYVLDQEIDAAVQRALASRADVPLPITPAATDSTPNVAPSNRTVSPRAAFYAAVTMLVIGLVGGLLLNVSPLIRRWTDDSPAVVRTPDVVASRDGQRGAAGAISLTVVDRTGRTLNAISAERPWTPRFSPDGRSIAYGAFGAGRQTSDLWVTDLEAGTTRRLTDDDRDSNDPQWSTDGATIAYSVAAPGGKDLATQLLAQPVGFALASRDGTQFPSDWLRDGSALLVTEEAGNDKHNILVQPADGSTARPYIATSADETAARISPDGRWAAYTSDASGQAEVYIDSYPRRTQRVKVSSGGGLHPVWRRDGRELYYWRSGALIAVELDAAVDDLPPARGAQTVLFRAPYLGGVNTMYDVSPDGKQFVIVRQP